jgi:hypothetical protein
MFGKYLYGHHDCKLGEPFHPVSSVITLQWQLREIPEFSTPILNHPHAGTRLCGIFQKAWLMRKRIEERLFGDDSGNVHLYSSLVPQGGRRNMLALEVTTNPANPGSKFRRSSLILNLNCSNQPRNTMNTSFWLNEILFTGSVSEAHT